MTDTSRANWEFKDTNQKVQKRGRIIEIIKEFKEGGGVAAGRRNVHAESATAPHKMDLLKRMERKMVDELTEEV